MKLNFKKLGLQIIHASTLQAVVPPCTTITKRSHHHQRSNSFQGRDPLEPAGPRAPDAYVTLASVVNCEGTLPRAHNGTVPQRREEQSSHRQGHAVAV